MKQAALILAKGYYRTPNGKTAHGLVRGSDRFEIRAVYDPDCAGRDAGELLDGRRRGIPVLDAIAAALALDPPPRWAIVGIATHGGLFTPALHGALLEAIEAGLSIVNGLHEFAADDPELAAAAARRGVEIIDVRKPPPRRELHFWTGDIFSVGAPRLAVLGVDCALGKRTTARLLTQALNGAGVRAEMIYTGQTGWMQSGRFGFILDSLPNDYVAGELEHAIVRCDREARPEVILLEGQSGLRNPSGPCGAEYLVSAAARGVILQLAPGRTCFEGYEALGLKLPTAREEIELIRAYGARTLAVTLHGQGLSAAALGAARQRLQDELGIPVVRPLEDGVEALVPVIRRYLREEARP